MRRLGTVVLGIAVVAVGCGDEDHPAPLPDGPATFTVMTQNLYLGADLDPQALTSAGLAAGVEAVWTAVQATDFNTRAEVLADTIASHDPDLVGLQEVSIWRTQTPGDGFLLPDATHVEYDFLDKLLMELAARGLSYRAVASRTNGDAELQGSSGTDYRLTDRDVVLAKASLPIVSTSSGTFPHLATISIPLDGVTIPVPIPRGWVSVRFRAGGKTNAFFNTHLEAISEDIATLQAQDLVAIANPTAQPTVIVGDINSPPGSTGYSVFAAPATGLGDAWTAVNPDNAGFTCCWKSDLLGGALTTRIDVVFTTRQLDPTAAVKVNETERTPGGLAPSDHAGVVVALTPSQNQAAVARMVAGHDEHRVR